MKTKYLVTLLVLCMLLISATIALAAVTATNHDQVAYQNLVAASAGRGPCSFCHIPHGAVGDKLFPQTSSISGLSEWDGDPVAQICWYCHGSASGLTAAINVMPFQPGTGTTHGRDIADLITYGDITGSGEITANLDGLTAGNTLIGCDSCHDVHDNSVRPFLKENNTGSVNSGVLQFQNFATLCDDCHLARFNNAGPGAGSTRINHPTNTALAENTTNANILDWAGVVSGNIMLNQDWALNQPLTNGSVEHWNAGGKFYDPGVTNIMNCGTCHPVHQNELNSSNSPVSDDGDDGTVNVTVAANADEGNNRMLPYDGEPEQDGIAVAAICTQCHDLAGSGPGTSLNSHPYQFDYVDSGIGLTITQPTALGVPEKDPKWGNTITTNTAVIVCQSCHDMHFAQKFPADSTPVRGPYLDDNGGADGLDYSLQRVFCADCHADGAQGVFPDHHPSDIPVVVGDIVAVPPVIGASMNWATLTTTEIRTNTLTDRTAVSGDPTYYLWNNAGTDTIVCTTCHNSQAHNGFPGTTVGDDDDVMCVDCHGVNPSAYTDYGETQADRMGSHFLGPIAGAAPKSTWNWGTGSDPEVGAGRNLTSPDGANGSIICRSCHFFNTNAATPLLSTNTGDNESANADTRGLLLSSAGNMDVPGAADQNLCTGCHAAAPGGNTTHPVYPSNGLISATTKGAAIYTRMATANNWVTATGDNDATHNQTEGINCESCHRPHDADTDGGTYILEVAVTSISPNDGNPFIDVATLCQACHAGK